MAANLRTSAIGAASSVNATSSTIVVPADAVAGDYARLAVSCTVAGATLTTPAGWTVLAGPTVQGTNIVGYLLGKTLAAGDIGSTLTLTFSGSGKITSQMDVFSGVDPAGLIVAAPVIESSSDTTTTLPTLAGVPADAVVSIAFVGRVSSGTPPDLTPPAGYSQSANSRHVTTAASSSNLSTEALYKVASAAGSQGGEAATTSGGLSISFAVALPAVAGPPPLVAAFTANPTTGAPPLAVAFNSSATAGGTPPYTRVWDYGDGSGVGSAVSPNHSYAAEGLYTVSLTVTDSLGVSDNETKIDFINVTSAPPPAGPADTPTLLARPNKVTPNATFTDRWIDASPVADKTYDMRGSRFEGYFDADAIFGFGTFSDGAGGTNATAHQKNQFPIEIGDSTPAARAAIIGGIVTGDQPANLTWNRMKHGSHIQQALDNGQTGEQAWALIVNNQNQDGDARIHVAEGSWALVDGIRTYNTHDGFGIYGAAQTRADTGTVYFRNVWVKDAHDDAIENDRSQLAIVVEDCLFEECHTFLSTRAPDTSGTPDASKPQTIRDSIVWLKPRPGPYQQPTSVLGHGNMYKEQTNSPPLVMENVIIAIEKPNTSSAYDLPERAGLDSYTNVTLVWLGQGAYPAAIPSGVTLTTDRSILDDAVAAWKGRHGVTSFESVNMTLMLEPLADPPPPTVDGPLPGLIDGVEPEAVGHLGPFCDGNGNLYRVTEEYGAPVEPHNTPRMMKSTDGGATWAEMDAANRPSDNDLESGWMIQSGTVLYYIFTDGGLVSFNSFNTSDAAANPDTWQIKSEHGITGLSGGSQQFASAVRLSDGRFRVFFSDTQAAGPNRQIAFITRAAGGGWSAKTRLTVDADNRAGPQPVVGAANKVHVFYHDYAAKQVLYRTLTSAEVLSAAVRADTSGTNTASRNYNAVSNAVYYDASGTEVVSALFASASGLRLVSVVGGVVQAEQVVDANAPLVSPANTDGNTGNDSPVCHLAVDGTTLYALWTDAASGDLYWSKRPHGGAWTARAVLWDAPAARYASWVYSNVFTRGGQQVLGYTYDDGPHLDNESNIFYNRMVLAAAPPATGGRVVERWTGSALVPQRVDKWNGAALVQQRIDP